MRDKIQRFMAGRYGQDELNRALLIAALVCMALSMLWRPFYSLALVFLVFEIFRMLSRNFGARSRERSLYVETKRKVVAKFKESKNLLFGTKTHKIYRCKNCHQQIRVPRGKGKIVITCPKCKTEFVKRT